MRKRSQKSFKKKYNYSGENVSTVIVLYNISQLVQTIAYSYFRYIDLAKPKSGVPPFLFCFVFVFAGTY